jgi:hypothetical protein
MRDICAAEATAFETASTALGNGVGTLVGTHWTGDAASAFAGHIEATRSPIDAHVANLRAAAALFDDMGDTIDKAGNAIAMLIADLIGLVFNKIDPEGPVGALLDFVSTVAAGASAWNAAYDDAWMTIKNLLGPLVAKLISAVEGLVHAIDAATAGTEDLCHELNALAPPTLPSDAAGGMTPGEPEGLTEEQADPEGLTEEPNEPAGLTEEPNDAEPVEAGGQQSR